jgi:Glycosyltransferase like family 2
MVIDLQELARRMLADYDARTPGQLFGEPIDLTTVQAYALQAEIARLRSNAGKKSSATGRLHEPGGAAATGDRHNDTIVTEGWLEGLIRWSLFEWPKVGMVGPVTNFSSQPQQIGVDYQELSGLPGFAARQRNKFANQAQRVERLTGFCLLVRREVLDKIGGFDERFGLGFFDDDDLCVRARQASFELLLAQDVFVHHFGNRTFQGLGVNCWEQLTGTSSASRPSGERSASRGIG